MLAVFSAHAKKVKAGDAAPASGNEAAFAERVVPAYAHCLIQVRVCVSMSLQLI